MTTPKSPTLLDALIPIAALVMMLALSVTLFGSDSSSGPNQIVLTLAAAVASIVAIRNGHKWFDLQAAMIAGISTAMVAILILLAVASGSAMAEWVPVGGNDRFTLYSDPTTISKSGNMVKCCV